MGEYVIKLPDVGEGVAEAELVEWFVEEGVNVREDEVLASVMTDKATVEIPSPVEGKVLWRGAKIGEIVAVGAPIIRIEIEGEGNVAPGAPAEKARGGKPEAREAPAPKRRSEEKSKPNGAAPPEPAPMSKAKTPAPPRHAAKGAPRKEGEKPLAPPAVRRRALDAGIDLRRVAGTGPAGRITHADLDTFLESGGRGGGSAGRVPDLSVNEVPVIGLRRKIAERMSLSKSRIPHIAYVEEVDVTALEELRAKLNAERKEGRAKLTLIPFLMRAMARAIVEQPQINAHYDDEAGVLRQHGGVHIGVAAQTDAGLVVPVVRHVEAAGLWECAAELARLAEGARAGTLSREELTGSTITISSLGALGGIVSTPVINHPEVAIVGVNKIQILPRWDGSGFVPRKVMNLSSSFDHRIVDGWNAAMFIQKVKSLLEAPAIIFIED